MSQIANQHAAETQKEIEARHRAAMWEKIFGKVRVVFLLLFVATIAVVAFNYREPLTNLVTSKKPATEITGQVANTLKGAQDNAAKRDAVINEERRRIEALREEQTATAAHVAHQEQTLQARWNEERVLERYELLYEAGLAAEAARDRSRVLGAGHLGQAELGPVGPLTHELGVDGDEFGIGQRLAESGQFVSGGDELH